MAEKQHISFIGLGAMGFGMATHLLNQGYQVTAFDIYTPTLTRFRETGGLIANSPAEAVSGTEFCICMVATAQQAQSVLLSGPNAALGSLPQGAVVLLCSTVPCSYVRALEREIADGGRPDVALVDCPVSGGVGRAADGTLSIMASASELALQKARFLLEAMADPRKLYIVNGGIGAGSNMKMVHQVLAAVQILSANEAMGLAYRFGFDLPNIAAKIIESEGWSWMFEHRVPRMLQPGKVASAVSIILKDAGIITSEARRTGFATPMVSVAEQVYLLGVSMGYGGDDDSSLIRLYTSGKDKDSSVSTEDKKKTDLVVSLLKGIHLVSAVEALKFAHHVSLDLEQVFELCINAAGGSRMLSEFGAEIMAAVREGKGLGLKGEVLDGMASGLKDVVDEAQMLRVPLFLGSQALYLLGQAQFYGSLV